MRNIGFMVDAIDASQQGFYLSELCNRMSKETDIIPHVFYETYDRVPVYPSFVMMQNCHAWSFNGPLVATNLHLAKKLTTCFNKGMKYFYTWNLEWLYTNASFKFYHDIYMHADLELIARSTSHATILTKSWKTPTHIIEDFNYDAFCNLSTPV